MDEFEQLPWLWIGDTGYGMYGSEELVQAVNPVLSLTLSTLGTPTLAFDMLQDKARRRHWWTRGKTLDRREGALQVEADKIGLIHSDYHTQIQLLGLEGVAPSLDEYSKQTMDSTVKDTVNQAALHRAASFLNLQTKGSEYAGLAFDTARSIFNDNRDVYDGKHGNIAQGLDSAGDSFANAAMASGNPWAMMAGAAYKGMSLLNQTIGHSTDGMTKTDAILDSNLGFALTGGLNKLNAKFGTTTDKFDVDTDLKAEMGASYMDTYGDFEDAASKAGKRYGWLSRGAARRAQNEISMANYRLDLLLGINDQSQDREAAAYYEGIGIRNQNALTGGFRAARAARKGIKFNLDFAHKVVRAQGGIRFNMFEMVDPGDITPDAAETPALVPPELLSEAGTSFHPGLTEYDLTNLGVTYREIDDKGNLVYNAPSQGIIDTLTKNRKLISNLTRKYGVKGIRFELASTSSGSLQTAPQNDLQNDLEDNALPGTVTTPLSDPSPEELDREWLEELAQEKLLFMLETLDQLLGNDDRPEDQVIATAAQMIKNHYPEMSDKEAYEKATKWYETRNSSNGYQEIDPDTPPPYAERPDIHIFTQKKGGTFTFTPYTDEQVNKFKAGGSFNVIPEGALHKNKHHMEDAQGLTKKGIPVVTEEDGKKVQQAEIEVNEIIFRLEVTEKLERLAKEDNDNAALEAGKLITEEILHNTHDNTGLIKETV